MDHGDAVLQRIERALQANVLATQLEAAGIGGVDAGQNLHQRRFAGAILPHQRLHRAPL